ncbi:hydroxymethylglutaryl-CoA reductase, degradative [Alloscardovia criceti]|uniref:hydroxymethylglutaryl-CoA reductase, degradative n=1 Tax=Alloscardovia criceti TaxID=356828 RepID=UPI00036629B1|nr:hydroxymethylglutaryl-CoA reductase, degradative [Alloscardovia criceti]
MNNARRFYQLSARERLDILLSEGVVSSAEYDQLVKANEEGILDKDVAAHLIENQISQYALPFSVARELKVNGHTYNVPMVVEEASVVAAASHGATMVARCGGVQAWSQDHRVIGEIVFPASEVSEESVKELIVSRGTELFDIARNALPSMHKRGGGLMDISVDTTAQGNFVRVLLTINPCDAMGANAVNTIAEALKTQLSEWLGSAALVAILSNSADYSLTQASVELTPESVAIRGIEPARLVHRIALLSDLAQEDYARAVTHNKGIMNGISAAVLASGNDTRAVEASAHAYAAHSGRYMPLSQWWINDAGNLCGRIELPLQVGIVGGAASSLPLAKIARTMGGYQSVTEFKNVLAALGLVQNLSALRALAGPGIQEGHMSLQMNALAIAAGATGEEIDAVANALRALPAAERTAQRAQDIVQSLREAQASDVQGESHE